MRKRRKSWQGLSLRTALKQPVVKTLVKAFFVVLIFIVSIAALGCKLYNSSYFKITRIQILPGQGGTNNSSEHIKSALSPLLNTFLGKSIFKYSLLQDVKKVIESAQILHIKKAAVLRRLPDTLVVTVQNRKAFAQIKKGAKFYIIDEEGFIITSASSEPYPDLTIVDSLDVTDALVFLKYISSSEHFKGKKPSMIDVSNSGDVSFWIEGIEVRFGDREIDSDKKLTILERLLTDAANKSPKPKYIDLRFENPAIGTR